MLNKGDQTVVNLQNKRRMLFFMWVFFAAVLILIGRLGYIQLVNGNEYRKAAYEQWSKDVVINAKRGTIYDSKGKKLAVSVNADTVIYFPEDIKKGSSFEDFVYDETEEDGFLGLLFSLNDKLSDETMDSEELEIQNQQNLSKSLEEISVLLAEILEMDSNEVYNMITEDSTYGVLKRWITPEQSEKIKEAKIPGISIIEDNKRVYPYGNFASYILGFTDSDQHGLYGVEATYDEYLAGVSGRMILNTDAHGRELPYGFNEYFEPENGYGVVLTIDETIQHFAEKSAEQALLDTHAKRVSIILMDPKTGDVLAMTTKDDYDPNNPREPLDDETKIEWSNLTEEEEQQAWYDMWRNPIVNDVYEPGSTFKPLVIAMALQENATQPNRIYHCDGFVSGVAGETMKCWRYYNPHGDQTLSEVLQNSCNDAMADIVLELGAEKFYEYSKMLGFGEISGIDLNGEAVGILNHHSYVTPPLLIRQSIGQSIAVTPLQLTTAIAALSNGGNLMEPRVVKQLIDEDGNIIESFDPVVRRTVFSESVSNEVMEMMRTVVSEAGASAADVPGFSVGGKTGTAQKVINGVYPDGVFISSFIGVAPTNDPEVVCLMIVDEPDGNYYASVIAAPIVGDLIEEVMQYKEIEPQYTDEELGSIAREKVDVPNLIGLTLEEASNILEDMGLNHNVTLEVDSETTIKDQFPIAETEVTKNSTVTLILVD